MQEKRVKIHYVSFAVLVFAVLWYIVAQFVMVPRNDIQLNKKLESGEAILANCEEIFKLDPVRLKFSETRKEVGQFQYTTVIDKLSSRHGIKPSDYDIRTEAVIKRSNRKTQGATMVIKTIDMMRFTSFITEFVETWPGIEVNSLQLSANDAKDDWKATLRFTYTIK